MTSSPELIKQLASKYGYLEYMVTRYLEMFGEDEIIPFLKGNAIQPIPSIRTNTIKVSPQVLRARLEEKKILVDEIPDLSEGFFVKSTPFALGATTEYLMGYYYIQSRVSMLASVLLDPSPGTVVIDACAAPGGKTTHLAQLMNNEGMMIACDLSSRRIKSLISNLSRCGINNCICYIMDAHKLPELGVKANKIMLDAPCTGEGLVCIDPSRKQSRRLEDLHTLSQVQEKLLKAAIQAVKKGGEILYSTCSVGPEENEFVIDPLIKEGKVDVLNLDLSWGDSGFTSIFNRTLSPSLEKARRFYPYRHGTEGFFICKLKKME